MREIKHHHLPDSFNAKVKVETADDPASKQNPTHYRYDFYLHGAGGWNKAGGIGFQRGPFFDKEGNSLPPNGVTNESVLSVLIDRLKCYQQGEYPCQENSQALAHLYEALWWLHERTRERISRGVEGKEAK